MEPIKLKYPIKVDGVEVKSLKMRRPKLRDRLAVDDKSLSDLAIEVNLIANLCEVQPEALHELELVDYTAMQATFSGFLS